MTNEERLSLARGFISYSWEQRSGGDDFDPDKSSYVWALDALQNICHAEPIEALPVLDLVVELDGEVLGPASEQVAVAMLIHTLNSVGDNDAKKLLKMFPKLRHLRKILPHVWQEGLDKKGLALFRQLR